MKTKKEFKIEKQFTHKGLKCVVIKFDNEIAKLSHRCGYVGVKPEHPLFEVHYSEHNETLERIFNEQNSSETEIGNRGTVTLFLWDGKIISPEIFFDVHGSITYSGGSEEEYPTKHKNIWWFGYDCAHSCDNEDGGRSLEYCIDECKSLAKQLAEVAK